MVELLLTAGANKNGAASLYIASQQGHHTVVELLLATDVDRNAAQKDGATPLYIASRVVVELLLAAEADKMLL